MHLDAEQIQRVIDGEQSIAESTETRTHLAACEACRTAVGAAARDEPVLFALLGTLDNAPRRVRMETVRVLARGSRSTSQFRWAAMLLAAVGIAGVAYAVPYPALRAWVQKFSAPATPVLQSWPASAPSTANDLSGVAVAPGASTTVLFTSFQRSGEARVILTDGQNIEVRAPAGEAIFAAGAGAVTVQNEGATASYEILVPRNAPRVEIRIAGSRVWTKQGKRTVSDHVRDADGGVRISLRRE